MENQIENEVEITMYRGRRMFRTCGGAVALNVPEGGFGGLRLMELLDRRESLLLC